MSLNLSEAKESQDMYCFSNLQNFSLLFKWMELVGQFFNISKDLYTSSARYQQFLT